MTNPQASAPTEARRERRQLIDAIDLQIMEYSSVLPRTVLEVMREASRALALSGAGERERSRDYAVKTLERKLEQHRRYMAGVHTNGPQRIEIDVSHAMRLLDLLRTTAPTQEVADVE